jgi:plastocyanin
MYSREDFRPGRRGFPGWRAFAIAIAATVMALSLIGIHDALARPGGKAEASRAGGVHISTVVYMPKVLHVRRGTTVTWTNESQTTHTATRRGSFDTGVIRPGRSASVKFTQKGTFSYFCRVHPFMHGKIVVE